METLLLYRLLVTFELYIAEFMFAMRLHKRKYFALRFLGCILVTEGIAALLPLYFNAFYTSLTFFLIFAVTIPMLKFCCDESWKNIIFCGIAAYTMQHLAYGAANFLISLVTGGLSPVLGAYFEGKIDFGKMDYWTLLIAAVYIFAYFCSYTACYYMFVKKIKKNEEFHIQNVGVLILVAFALIVDILLNSIIIYYGGERDLLTTLMSILYETFCCAFLLYIQFGLIRAGNLKNELDITQCLLREREKQYNLSKENIELINLKCHDLRHQIRDMSCQSGLSADMVKEIENSISIYDAAVHTENEVLDVILTEKSLHCSRDGIELSCVIDGHSLDFMDAVDIYSLFGNALENAMEAVMRMDESKRMISVSVHKTGEIVSVNIGNPYEGEITLGENKLPITTKADKNFHGIGMRSMSNIALKYNGICSVSLDNNVFMLNVLLMNRHSD